MPIEVEFEGQVHEFPDDFTDAEIAAALEGLSAPKQATPLPPSATIGMLAPSTVEGDPQSAPGGWNPQHAELGRRVTEAPMMAEPLMPNITKVPGIVARGLGISKVRAGQNMQAAAEAAKEVPVATGAVSTVGARAKELQATGSRLPRVVTQFMKRVEDGSDLSFREAQDFVSNMSRMSANEFNSLNPQMHRQVTQMAQTLRQALTEAAGTVGKGEQYARGVSEYAKAARFAKLWEEKYRPAIWKTTKTAAKWATGGAGLYGASRFGD